MNFVVNFDKKLSKILVVKNQQKTLFKKFLFNL